MRAKRKKKKPTMKRLGILEKVEEVGVERFLSASPAPSSIDEDNKSESSLWAAISKPTSRQYKAGKINRPKNIRRVCDSSMKVQFISNKNSRILFVKYFNILNFEQ